MIEVLIHHSAACLIDFLLLLVLTFLADRLGLIAWLAWLDRCKGDRRAEKRHDEATEEYWRIHE
jgi:hypothetical protein